MTRSGGRGVGFPYDERSAFDGLGEVSDFCVRGGVMKRPGENREEQGPKAGMRKGRKKGRVERARRRFYYKTDRVSE